ncbi:MAG: hypothetical protein JEZ14_18815 [Marinilabiliaceae bacterium]|nr:hypothetical protein [Marinilabiliaceae bacterium]
MAMDELQTLQSIWQGRKLDTDLNITPTQMNDSIIAKIKQTEKKVFRLNILKTAVVSLLILTLLWSLRDIRASFVWIGMGVIVMSTLIMMIKNWRIQFKSSNLNHDLPQNEFIDDTIMQMKGAHVKFVKLFRVFVFFLMIGINLLYVDLLQALEMPMRLLLHGIVTNFMLIVFALGLFIRRKKFKKEFQPLIDELETLTQQ